MYITILAIVIFSIISFMVLWAIKLSKTKEKVSKSNEIIQSFEHDISSHTLTDMIEFHKNMGVVEYQI